MKRAILSFCILLTTSSVWAAGDEIEVMPDDQIVVNTSLLRRGSNATSDPLNWRTTFNQSQNSTYQIPGPIFLRGRNSGEIVNIGPRVPNEAEFRAYSAYMVNILDLGTNQRNGNLNSNRIFQMCRYLVTDKASGGQGAVQPDQQTCGILSDKVHSRCGLNRRISDAKFEEIQKAVGDNLASKAGSDGRLTGDDVNEAVRECVHQTSAIAGNSSEGQLYPTMENAVGLLDGVESGAWSSGAFGQMPRLEQAQEELRIVRNCYDLSSVDQCNDFDNTVIKEPGFEQLARLYVVAAPRIGGGFLGLKGKKCSTCLPERYEFLKSQTGDQNDESESDFRQQSDAIYKDYVRRKAIEKAIGAYSEYAKFFDRQHALETMLGVERKSDTTPCSDGANFIAIMHEERRAQRGCVDDNEFKARMDAIARQVSGVQTNVANEGALLDVMRTSLHVQTYDAAPATCSGGTHKVARDGYDRVRSEHASFENINRLNKVITHDQYRNKISNCGDNQICLTNELKDYLQKVENKTKQQADQIVQQTYLNNPYLRLFVQTRQGWVSAGRIKEASNVASFFANPTNKREFTDLATQDAQKQCENLTRDLAKSLCMTPEKAPEMLGGARMRADMDREMEKIRNDATNSNQIEKNLNLLKLMGAACNAMSNMRNDAELDNSTTAYAADTSADVDNYADPVLRMNMLEPSGGAKTGDEFGAYARALCNPMTPSSTGWGGMLMGSMGTTRDWSRYITNGGTGLGTNAKSYMGTDYGSLDTLSLNSITGAWRNGIGGGTSGGGGGYGSGSGYGSGTGGVTGGFDDSSLFQPQASYFNNPIQPTESYSEMSLDGASYDELARRNGGGSGQQQSYSYSPTAGTNRGALRVSQTLGAGAVTGDDSTTTTTTVQDSETAVNQKDVVTTQRVSEDVGTPTTVVGDVSTDATTEGFLSEGGQTFGMNNFMANTTGNRTNRRVNGSFNTGNGIFAQDEEAQVGQTNTERLVVNEERLAEMERRLLTQLQEAQGMGIQMQREMMQMQIEMQQLRSSNNTLMASVRRKSETRERRGETNTFDAPEEDVVEEVEEEVPQTNVVANNPVNNSGPRRNPASIPGSAPLKTDFAELPSGNGPILGNGRDSRGVSSAGQGTDRVSSGGGVARGVNVGVSGGGLAASGVGRSGGAVATANFVPSLTLQQSFVPEAQATGITQDRKVELLQEFLSYVEKKPEHREGRYLSTDNNQVTIDYQGQMVVVKVNDISDPRIRDQLQERLMRQRVLLNQYTRNRRLIDLQRLLASRGTNVP